MRGNWQRWQEESGAGPFWRMGPPPPWARGGGRFGPGAGPGHGFGPWWGGGGWPGGPAIRNLRKARRGDVRTAILALLAEQPRNGYQIIQEIAERSGGMWRPSPGSVYPALSQLEDEGLIVAQSSGGQRAFSLTEAGQAYVEEHRERLEAPWRAMESAVPEGLAELAQLGGSVAMAAVQVAQAGSSAQVAEAVRVLDETRKALYRILAEAEPEETEGEADV